MSVFELAMLICFGANWPAAVYKTYKTKNVKGKSRLFLFLVLFGYICGITHKIIYNFDLVIILYIVNTLLVLADVILYYKYRKLSL